MDFQMLKGTGVATITPFRADGSIDFTSYKKHINRLIDNGINNIVALGTTSEVATYSKDEARAVVDFIIETVDKRVPVIVGIGGNNTNQVIQNFKNFDFSGIDAILSVVPYYSKPTQKGIYEHYKAIANAAPKPIILYNVPSRTSKNMEAETMINLANDFKNIIAVKEASGDLNQVSMVLKHAPKHFAVISGDDQLTVPMMAIGAIGVISVAGNAIPKQFSQMINYALEGDFAKAKEIHLQTIEFMHSLFLENNPGGVKAALKALGIIQNNLRLPLTRVSKSNYQVIAKQLSNLGLL